EADQLADERVVPAVGGVGIVPRQQEVEALLGVLERGGHVVSEPTEPGCADRDEQRLDRHLACLEIGDSLLDELASRQRALSVDALVNHAKTVADHRRGLTSAGAPTTPTRPAINRLKDRLWTNYQPL